MGMNAVNKANSLQSAQELTMVTETSLLLIGRYGARVGRGLTGAVEVTAGS